MFLVLMPSLVGASSIVALNGLWQATNQLIDRSQQLSKLTLTQSEAFSDLVPYCGSALSFTFEGQPEKKAKAGRDRDQLVSALQALKTATASSADLLSPEGKALPDDIANTLRDADKLCQNLTNTVFFNNLDRFRAFSRLMKSGLTLAANLQSASNFQTKEEQEIERQYDTISGITTIGIFAGLALTIFCCGLTLLAYSKIIFERFKAVRKNAARLTVVGGPQREIEGDDELAYLDGIFCDVGEELQQANEANAMLMQMLAHDVRSPIMATQVSIQLFEEVVEDSLTEEAVDTCDSIQAELNKVLELVTNFLLVDRLESGTIELEYTDFALDQCLQDCLHEARKDVRSKALTINNNCPPITVCADQSQIKRVISNFLASSLRAAPEESTVTIDCIEEGGNITLKFSDQGKPPAVALKKQLFSKVFIDKREDQRLDRGMSLVLSKLIVEQHDGRCGFTNASNRDCTIWFTLPLKKSFHTPGKRQTADGDVHDLSDWKSIFRPGLARQGLILAVVPLVFQVTGLLWLNGEVSKASRLQKVAREQSAMVDLTNRLWLQGVQANANMGFFIVSGDRRSKQAALENISALKNPAPPNFSDNKGDATTKQLWQETLAFTRTEAAKMENLLSSTSPGSAAEDLGTMPALGDRGESISNKLRTLLKEELKRLTEARTAQEQSMSAVHNTLILMFAVDLAVCLALLLYFGYRTKRRLDRLIENAAKLPRRELLAPVMEATDELQELDHLIHQAESYLRQADRQHALLLDTIKEEIEKPLGSIARSLGELTKFAQKDFQAHPMVQKCLKQAKTNNLRVLSLVTELLALESADGGLLDVEITTTALKEVFAEAVESVASLLESKSISMQVSCPDIQVKIDRGRIVQVLVNLIGNATKFAPNNSTISLTATASKNGLKLAVTDNGPGMDRKTADRVFDKFFKSSNQKSAAFGLGLAICKLIVESHHGTIEVDTEPGKGCTFWLLLPDAI
ncbi:MAG: HAMP domain-containing histidine kinase [Cyanobacteria bacterium SZAS TMP-1]|nr:HAMP domain-containing histidine kinase [Cyanobacteria bacterium SZAS TMP-1]